MSDDLRKLKDEAAEAAEKGKHRRAAELYLKVGQREKDDPQWRQRAGEALKRAGSPAEAMPLLISAAQGYAKIGFLLKAIAVAKLILQIDPKHAETQAMLSALYARESGSKRPLSSSGLLRATDQPHLVDPPAKLAPTSDPPPRPGALLTIDDVLPLGPDLAPLKPRRSAPPVPIVVGDPIDSIALADVMEGAHQAEEFEELIYEIPLDEDEYDDDEPIIEVVPGTKLPPIPLFSSLDQDHLQRLIEQVRTSRRAAGEAVVREGEKGDTLYVVVHGEVEVSVAGRAAPLGRLGEGAFFGELAVFSDQPRAATVTAVGPTEVLEIDRKVVSALVKDDQAVLRTLLRFFRDRLIARLIATSPLFESFSAKEARNITSRFRFLEVGAGKPMLREGVRAPGLFVILSGSCEVIQGKRSIAKLAPGDIAGELSCLTQAPAAATVRALTRVCTLALPREKFQELILTHPQVLVYLDDVAEKRRQRVEKLHLA